MAEIMPVVNSKRDTELVSDYDATVEFARASGKADMARMGITGFCRGGRTTLVYAAANPKLKAAVAWYGSPGGQANEAMPRTPMDRVAEIKVPLLGLYGAKDAGMPVDQVEKFFAALKAAGTPFRIRRLSRGRAWVPRRLPPRQLPQGGCRGRLEAHARVVQEVRRRRSAAPQAFRRGRPRGPPVAFPEESAGALLRSRTRPPTRTRCRLRTNAFRAVPVRANQPGRRFTPGDGGRTRFARQSCRGGRVAHRPAGLGQVDARNGARAKAVRSRLAGLYARRRQCAPRPQRRSRVSRRRTGRKTSGASARWRRCSRTRGRSASPRSSRRTGRTAHARVPLPVSGTFSRRT